MNYFEEGYEDYYFGIYLEDNPYEGDCQYEEWSRGWIAACDEDNLP